MEIAMEPNWPAGVDRDVENLVPDLEQSDRIDLGLEKLDPLPRCRIAVCQWDASKRVPGSRRWRWLV
jgi:hypothetical protein